MTDTKKSDILIPSIRIKKHTKAKDKSSSKSAIDKLTPAEARRIRLEQKLSTNPDYVPSKLFNDIAKRCPGIHDEYNQNITNNKNKPSKKNKYPDFSHPYYDKNIGEIVENLDVESINSDSESYSQNDKLTRHGYIKDGFVTDSDDESYKMSDTDDNNDDSDNSNESTKAFAEEKPKLRSSKRRKINKKQELVEELNELVGDFVDEGGITNDERRRRNEVLKNLRISDANKVTIEKVISQKFNDIDNQWFYTELKRLKHLDGKERFTTEDMIQKRYDFLKELNTTGAYDLYSGVDTDRDLLTEIVKSKFTNQIKSIMIAKLKSITQNVSPEEYQKTVQWIDTVLSIPTDVKNSDKSPQTIIMDLHKSLKSKLSEMDETIFSVLQAVSAILSDKTNNGYIIALLGPPGVGKTTISHLIADISGMGFGHISCGSINDQSTLIGHGSTYIGSKPGVFMQTIINNKQLNNVIVLDELDKIEDSKIVPVLLQLLDPSQNKHFRDAYCPEIPVDMSKNLYVVTLNKLDKLDRALIDRMRIINIKPYSINQQITICVNHVIPDLNKRYNLNIMIDKKVIGQCIKKYIFEINNNTKIIRHKSTIRKTKLSKNKLTKRKSTKHKTIKVNESKNINPESNNVNGVRDTIRLFADIFERIILINRIDNKNKIIKKIFVSKKSLTIDDIKNIRSYENKP